MTAQLKVLPENFLQEDFEFEGHPADLEQIIEAAFEKYETIPGHTIVKRKFRQRLNELVDKLTEMRSFRQFTYAH